MSNKYDKRRRVSNIFIFLLVASVEGEKKRVLDNKEQYVPGWPLKEEIAFHFRYMLLALSSRVSVFHLTFLICFVRIG
jgi:hypothetical protein